MNKSANLARRQLLRQGLGGCLAMASMGSSLEAFSSNEARTISLRNLHTHEHLRIAYWADGKLLQDNLIQLSQFLRDHRQNEAMLMDAGLFDQLWQIDQNLGCRCTFEIISGYRSPKTNALLRSSSQNVAQNSYHLRGKALDIRVIGLPTAKLRRHARALRAGGVGYYPNSNFVHVDTGPSRTWTS